LTLAWSIGLGILLIGISTVLLLPATKSARIRFEERREDSLGDESRPRAGETRTGENAGHAAEPSP
jgi:hypothetical protein